MNRQVGACHTISVGIVLFFAAVLKPVKESEPPPTASVEKPSDARERKPAPRRAKAVPRAESARDTGSIRAR